MTALLIGAGALLFVVGLSIGYNIGFHAPRGDKP